MHCHSPHHRRESLRRGLTMPELLIASSIVALMLAALGTLAVAVDSGHAFSHGRSVATQHARVATERITRQLNRAHASSVFPGFVSFRETVGAFSFPDTLVVWRPEATAANPDGLPLVGELIVYCPNPNRPAELWEITARQNTQVAPALSDGSEWATLIAYFQEHDAPTRVVVTDLLRTATISGDTGPGQARGAVRFDVSVRPTAADLQSFQDGDITWDEVPWVQGIYGESSGLRQSWCSIELQLMPDNWSTVDDPRALSAIPFFASGAVYYEVTQ
jgi:prepilin-type N-terminal cleavage/methylation domain-containing protein